MIYVGKRQVLGAYIGTTKVNKMFLGEAVTYAPAQPVTYVFDGVTTTAAATAPDGEPFSAPLYGASGKAVLPDSVKVEMGGVDITATAYNLLNNTVEIDEVTAPITITAEGVTAYSGYKPLAYLACVVIGSNKPGLALWGNATNQDTKVYFELMKNGGTNEYLITEQGVGRTSAHYIGFWFNSSKPAVGWGGTNKEMSSSTAYTPQNNTRFYVTIDKGYVTYKCTNNNTEKTLTYDARTEGQTFSSSKNVTIYGNKNLAASSGARGRVYRIKRWDNNVLAVDFIPAVRESDGVAGLLNLVTGNFGKSVNSDSIWIGPYSVSTNTLTDCTIALTSGNNTGTTTQAVIGSNWSVELTPSAGYTFGTSPIVVTIGGVDKTSEVASYDSSTGKWTIAINNVPMKPITITAAAHAAAA